MRTRTRLVRPQTIEEVVAVVRDRARRPGRGLIARGLGRSYGDPAQNSGGLTIDATGLNRILAVDATSVPPTVEVQAGVSLDTLMQTLLPFGLWLPVLPGTRYVTIGGAIAADVHGKNHHSQGSFGDHVRSIDLLTADGEIRTIGPQGDDRELFWATVGGMGLTGIILQATVAVQSVETAYFRVDTDRAATLDELLPELAASYDHHGYVVAWFDAVRRGEHQGRAVLTCGDAARLDELPPTLITAPLTFTAPSWGSVPDVFPNGLLNALTARIFNEVRYRTAPRHRRGEIQNITQFFSPLDVAENWNRAYGPAGFLQYQFQVPLEAEDTVRRCVEMITHSGHYSVVNVLKRFGPANPAPLSFPTPGWNLAADFPIRPGLAALCERLDEQVMRAGGRLYLAKDSRLSAADFATMYPDLDRFRAVRQRVDPDGLFSSDQARRLRI